LGGVGFFPDILGAWLADLITIYLFFPLRGFERFGFGFRVLRN
jgi:hypothetical protein